jgi:predicted ATPase
MSNPPRIKSITVKGLFNQFYHHIELNQEERITILHGINGVGKTTILRMIESLFNSRIYRLNPKIPFESFIVKLSDGTDIEIKRESNEKMDIIINEKFYTVKFQDDGFIFDANNRNSAGFIEQEISEFSSIKVLFIETYRLSEGYRVVECNDELVNNIEKIMTDYGKIAEKLDQSFPFRLLKHAEFYPKKELKEHIEALQNKRKEFIEIGLLPETDLPPMSSDSLDDLGDHHAAVMNLYVKDSEGKLEILESIGKKIKRLLDIINSKFQGKELRVDEKKGLMVISNDGNKIDLTQLSSGEQHEIVMFYDLIFKVEPNTLVMIDEPELSLHITWQHKFIDELKKIVELSKFDVLIATHSPTIVGDNSHLMVGLGNNE